MALPLSSSSPSPPFLSSSLSLPLRASFQGGASLSWPCPSRPRIVLFFIPGNPGMVDYYLPYLDTIYNSRECKDKVEILAVGHRGHGILEPTNNEEDLQWQRQETSLEAQVKHKVQVVKTIRRSYPRKNFEDEDDVKIVIIGHSVGSWMGLRVLEEMGDDVDGLHLLFPTVMNIASTPKARTLPLLLITLPVLPTILLPPILILFSFLPSILIFAALRIISPAHTIGLRTTFKLVTTPSTTLNAALMAREEFLKIKGLTPAMSNAVTKLRERGGTIRSYWSRGDEDSWAPSHSREELEKALKMVRIRLPANIYSSPSDISASMGKGKSSAQNGGLLHSRTLQVGSLARAAGNRLKGGYYGLSPQSKRGPSIPSSPAGIPLASTTAISSPRLARSAHSHPAIPSQRGEEACSPSASPLRKRTIPMTSSGRRRPSINLATAKRSFDGSITLELPEGENWDYLQAGSNLNDENENGEIEEEEDDEDVVVGTQIKDGKATAEEEDDVFLDKSTKDDKDMLKRRVIRSPIPLSPPLDTRANGSELKQLGAGNGDRSSTHPITATDAPLPARRNRDRGREAVSSTVCELGMPHAFCLRYGPQMGRVTARWVSEDWL